MLRENPPYEHLCKSSIGYLLLRGLHNGWWFENYQPRRLLLMLVDMLTANRLHKGLPADFKTTARFALQTSFPTILVCRAFEFGRGSGRAEVLVRPVH